MRRFYRYVEHKLGLRRRFGVRYGGSLDRVWEQTGFYWRAQAERWAREQSLDFVVFEYEPAIDLRIQPKERYART